MDTRTKLTAIAKNLWWSWQPEVIELFRSLNPGAFRASNNSPMAALRLADEAVLADAAFAAKVDAAYAELQAYLDDTPRFGDGPRTSYFCMEYGLHESLPLYSGGLGILAGDHCKAASDVGLPFTAIGIFLRDGYFKQYFDETGWQQAEFPSLDATEHPFELVKAPGGEDLTVTVHLGWQPLHLRAWKLQVGRIPLYLLDSDFDANPFDLRFLTRRLYQGDRTTRIQQEIILGIGGRRMLCALGVETDVFHMNEGHCAFLTYELLREQLEAGKDRVAAEDWVRQHCVFTTHTPVKAGHDRFDPALFLDQMGALRQRLGFSEHDMLAYGRVNPHDMQETFTMTVLGLKLARAANGVSKLNGEVARRQWDLLYPDRPIDEVPIGHVTNGIHLPTWTAGHARPFLRQHLPEWPQHRSQTEYWDQIHEVSDADLWAYRRSLRQALIDYINDRLPNQTLKQTANLDPDALTICFARRFATYKRAPLLFWDKDRIRKLFTDAERPIQVVYAGKAHPADSGGKRFIQEIYEMTQDPDFAGKLILLEGYDMEIGRMLVSGADVWLNNPRRPYEASGTSGQKVAMHGGLNLSILDGWWPEGFNEQNGWAIGHDAGHEYKDPSIQDPEDANYLYEALETSVLVDFYERDAEGLPQAWLTRMRSAMQTLPAVFSAERMVIDYIQQYYAEPAGVMA